MSFIAVVVALASLVASGSSLANVRLPVRCELPPSSALFSPSRDLTVMHEDLQFDCDSAGCQVSATYSIRSQQEAVLKMSFISPSDRVESVDVNGAGVKSGGVLVAKFIDYFALYNTAGENYKQIKKLVEESSKKLGAVATPEYQQLIERSRLAHKEWARLSSIYHDHHVELFGKLTRLVDAQDECPSLIPDLSTPKGWEHYVTCLLEGDDPAQVSQNMFGMKQQWELYQFDFDAAVLSGENTVEVRYQQPYSFAETSVAYFKSLSPMHYVSYELWPLKEWHLDSGFKIDLIVKFHNPRHGFMYTKRDGLSVFAGRLKDADTNGRGLIRNSPNLSPNTLEELPDDTLVYKTSLQGNIYDRLFIITSDNDTLNEVRKDYEAGRRFRVEHTE
jgi:hypothetical protein